MKASLYYIFFVLGLILCGYSIVERSSFEKELYRIYINEQKESLVIGWEKDWQNYLVSNSNSIDKQNKHTIYVKPNGDLITKDFFPKRLQIGLKGKLESKEDFESLLEHKGSYLRAIALRRLHDDFGVKEFSNLSEYERTLFDPYIKHSYSLIFNTIKEKRDFSSISEKIEYYGSLIKEEKGKGIEIFIPVEKKISRLYKSFLNVKGISGISLQRDNPFKLTLDENFDPLSVKSNHYRTIFILGLLLIVIAILFYLKDLQEKRKQAIKRIGFLNQLIHELKTPVTGIRLNGELLKKHGYDQELLDSVLGSGDRLIDFFDDIVLINKENSVSERIELTESKFTDFLNGIFKDYESKLKVINRNCEILKLDVSRTRVIIRNLIKNAIRYGKCAEIEILRVSDHLEINVRDEGPGISSNDSNRIFTEFYRSSDARNISPDGLGVGLSIVKKLCAEMNAEVSLENPGQKGAHFKFTIKDVYES